MELFQLIKKVLDSGNKAHLGFSCVATSLAGFPDLSILCHDWFVTGNDSADSFLLILQSS